MSAHAVRHEQSSWESWLIRLPDTQKIASSNLAEDRYACFFLRPHTDQNFLGARSFSFSSVILMLNILRTLRIGFA